MVEIKFGDLQKPLDAPGVALGSGGMGTFDKINGFMANINTMISTGVTLLEKLMNLSGNPEIAQLLKQRAGGLIQQFPAQRLPGPAPAQAGPAPAPPAKSSAEEQLKKIKGALSGIKLMYGDIPVSEIQKKLEENQASVLKLLG